MTSRLKPHMPLINHKLCAQPNARGAVGQLSGAVRKRAASVPEPRVAAETLLRAVVDADALSLEKVRRLHDKLTRGAPVLERLLAYEAGKFPAEKVDMQDWREMLKHALLHELYSLNSPSSCLKPCDECIGCRKIIMVAEH